MMCDKHSLRTIPQVVEPPLPVSPEELYALKKKRESEYMGFIGDCVR
jgi:hypothetical protein